MICLIVAIGQVTRILGKLNVVLGSKGGVSRWPEGDKRGKVQIELDANKLDIGPAAIGHGTILNWKQNRRVCCGDRIDDLSSRIIMEQQDRKVCEVAPVVVGVAIPVANSAVDCGIQADLSAKGVKHGTPVNARHGNGSLVDLKRMGPLRGLHCGGDDGVKLHSGLADGPRLKRVRYEQVACFCGGSSLDVGGGHSQQRVAPHNLERDGGLKRGSTGSYGVVHANVGQNVTPHNPSLGLFLYHFLHTMVS
jgi:hypothetical protein